jgi:predicted O-methyltransferase YrrM
MEPDKPAIKNRLELVEYFRKLGFKYGAEVGVRYGRYSEILCQNIPGLKLLCIDIWRGRDTFQTAKDRLSRYNTVLIQKSSMDAVKDIPDESLDFVFIDANHSYDSVKEDIREWTRKVRKGGIVSGHDYYVFLHSGNRGVIDAVDEPEAAVADYDADELAPPEAAG